MFGRNQQTAAIRRDVDQCVSQQLSGMRRPKDHSQMYKQYKKAVNTCMRAHKEGRL